MGKKLDLSKMNKGKKTTVTKKNGYRKLHENHSSIFAQMVLAFILAVSHFLIVGIDLYGKLCGDLETGAMLASLVCVGSAMWLMVLIVIAAIKMVIRKIKR